MSTVAVNDPVLTITPDHRIAIARAVDAMRTESAYPFTIDTLAEITNFSPFHFARLFRSLIGIPPGEFLAALRYDRAKELLLRSDLTVTEICFEVGYDSLGTFSSRFKRLIGLSPAGFRALPEVLDEVAQKALPPVTAIMPGKGTLARIEGDIVDPPAIPGGWHVYVGIFPASIARGVPIAGMRIAENERFALYNLPRGQFRLLAAAVPAADSPFAHLLPGSALMACGHPGILEITSGREAFDVSLQMRPIRLEDPPVLIALPALVLPSIRSLPMHRSSAFRLLAAAEQSVPLV